MTGSVTANAGRKAASPVAVLLDRVGQQAHGYEQVEPGVSERCQQVTGGQYCCRFDQRIGRSGGYAGARAEQQCPARAGTPAS